MAVRSTDHFISAKDVKVKGLYFGFILGLVFFDWFNLGDEYAYANTSSEINLSFSEDIYNHNSNEFELPEIIKEKWPSEKKSSKPKNLKELKYKTCEKTSGGLKCEDKVLKKDHFRRRTDSN